MKISVVTPSFNQGGFLELTMQSVLNQGYPDLEYIVIDGGSSDNSVEIMRKYQSSLAYWVSEKDRGETEAINKGLKRVTGDIWCYLCSDDTLAAGTLARVVEAFHRTNADVVYGNCNFITSAGLVSRVKRPGPFDHTRLLKGNYLYQPSVFLRRSVLDKYGFFDESLHYAMDYEYWLRASQSMRFAYVDEVLSNYRLHLNSKSMSAVTRMMNEARSVQKRYGAGGRADWTYFMFILWGRHYYRLKRSLFDKLAH